MSTTAVPGSPAFPWRLLGAMVASLSPTLLLAFFFANPERNVDLNIPLEHFVITTNVSLVAAFAGLLVARSALQLR